MSEREKDREKVGQGERGGQPQLSASVNVLTEHLNFSLCHELFVSPNTGCVFVCFFVCVLKVLQDRKSCGLYSSTEEPSLFLSTRSLPTVFPSAW